MIRTYFLFDLCKIIDHFTLSKSNIAFERKTPSSKATAWRAALLVIIAKLGMMLCTYVIECDIWRVFRVQRSEFNFKSLIKIIDIMRHIWRSNLQSYGDGASVSSINILLHSISQSIGIFERC